MKCNVSPTGVVFLALSAAVLFLGACTGGGGDGGAPPANNNDSIPPDNGDSIPPDGQSNGFEFVMGTDSCEVPDLALPQKGAAFTDPNFHTTLVRVTDQEIDGYIGPGIQNEYSQIDPENSDGTLVVLRGNTAAYPLYDTSSYEHLEPLTVFDACGQEPEPRWDADDPQTFYYVCNTELRSYNVATDVSATIHDFAADFPAAAYVSAKTKGDPSRDRRYWALIVEDVDWNLLAVVVYDRTSDEIVGRKTSDFREGLNWVGMSMSGEYCALGWDAYVAPLSTTVVSRDFSRVIDLPDGSAGHGDFAITADGREVYVYQKVRTTDHIAMADLETGEETALLPIPFDVNVDLGMHISGNAARAPGWVLVSTYGSLNAPPDGDHSWMDTRLFMLELTANPRIWRIAHTHSYTSLDYSDEKNYFAEAFATINTSGTRIYFGSNWADLSELDYTDTYQVVLPDDWPTTMPE